ncbi:MAG: hypothetical protein JW839_14500 [Candidatus Lokiarchaeota archaeon]|nr:hypothetical protein [Candidatus Lokiarchaeota archaeon]
MPPCSEIVGRVASVPRSRVIMLHLEPPAAGAVMPGGERVDAVVVCPERRVQPGNVHERRLHKAPRSRLERVQFCISIRMPDDIILARASI